MILEAAPRGPVCLQLSSWAGGVPGQLGGNSGLFGTRWVSITGEVAGDPEDAGFSKRAEGDREIQQLSLLTTTFIPYLPTQTCTVLKSTKYYIIQWVTVRQI